MMIINEFITLKKNLVLLDFLFFFVILVDVEVTELIGVLVRGDDVEPVTKLVLLQELLSQVLQVSLGVSNSGRDDDLGAAGVTGNFNTGGAELTGLTIDLEAVVEEVFEGGGIKDTVGNWSITIDHELGWGGNCRRRCWSHSVSWIGW